MQLRNGKKIGQRHKEISTPEIQRDSHNAEGNDKTEMVLETRHKLETQYPETENLRNLGTLCRSIMWSGMLFFLFIAMLIFNFIS